MKLAHVNIVTENKIELAQYYQKVMKLKTGTSSYLSLHGDRQLILLNNNDLEKLLIDEYLSSTPNNNIIPVIEARTLDNMISFLTKRGFKRINTITLFDHEFVFFEDIAGNTWAVTSKIL